MKITTALAAEALVLLTLSCAGLQTQTDQNISELKSEISVLKKRVGLIEKKNGVLEAENSDDKKEINSLRSDYEVLKSRTDKRIKELGELNARQKAEFINTASRLADEMKKKEKLYGDRIAQVTQEAAAKEKEFVKVIFEREKNLAEKSDLVAKKEKQVSDLMTDGERLKTEIKNRDATIAQSDQKIKDLTAALEKTSALVKERDIFIEKMKKDLDAANALLKEKIPGPVK
jgi:septal ring factor EnvC (AmiA/AmiB activator)